MDDLDVTFTNVLPPPETHVRCRDASMQILIRSGEIPYLEVGRDVNLYKKGAQGVFVLRRIVTTESSIFFCQLDKSEVMDEIKMHEVDSVTALVSAAADQAASKQQLRHSTFEERAAAATRKLLEHKSNNNSVVWMLALVLSCTREGRLR